MVHACRPLADILEVEPGYLQRIGLVTPPGHGYARHTLYDLTEPAYPGIAAWFNPLVAGDRRWIPGDQPAANRFKWLAGIPNKSYKEWSTDVLRRVAAERNIADLFFDKLATATGAAPDQLKQTLAGAQVAVDEDKNDFCLGKSTVTAPDGKAITGVTCTQENFNRAIDLLEGVIIGDGHRATPADLQVIKDAQHLPLITRGEKTEPIFKLFGVQTDALGLTVQGYAKRLGVGYPREW